MDLLHVETSVQVSLKMLSRFSLIYRIFSLKISQHQETKSPVVTASLIHIFKEYNKAITTFFTVVSPSVPHSCDLIISIFTCCVSILYSVTLLPMFLAFVNKYFTCVSLISFIFLAGLGTKFSLYILLALQMFLYIQFLLFCHFSSLSMLFFYIAVALLYTIFPMLKSVLKITQRLPVFSLFFLEETLSSIVLIFWYILPLCMKAFNGQVFLLATNSNHTMISILICSFFWKHKRQQKISLHPLVKTTVL